MHIFDLCILVRNKKTHPGLNTLDVRTIGARILHRQTDTVIPKYPAAKTLFTGGIKTYKHESNYVFSKMQN